MARTTDEIPGDVPVRIYEEGQERTGTVVYFHGGGFCSGGIALMEVIATELAHCAGAVVISVGYRLAPEHPYPAGLEDCEAVTRWVLANAERFGVPKTRVVVAGESAGGNLAAAVTLRLREASAELAGQILIYPVVDGPSAQHPSRRQFETAMLRAEVMDRVWRMCSGDRHLDDDPFAVPLQAESLAGLPPALMVLGGCDFLRDEGRLYTQRLQNEGVRAEEVCLPGQPHGFLNLGFPASEKA
jgi:acetyl esterase